MLAAHPPRRGQRTGLPPNSKGWRHGYGETQAEDGEA
jgi:hypothetical protein